jgi:hypothetical protein
MVAASSKLMPCLAKFAAFLALSHSNAAFSAPPAGRSLILAYDARRSRRAVIFV